MAENYFKKYPNKEGFFNEYGGAFIPPMLEDEMQKIQMRITQSVNRIVLFLNSVVFASIIRVVLPPFIIANVFLKNMAEESI